MLRDLSAIWSTKGGLTTPYIIVCNDDVDPTDLNLVIHAMTTKCHPVNGITVIPNAVGHPLLAFAGPHETLHHQGHWCLIDCTWPTDWPREHIPSRMSFEVNYPEEIKEKVLGNWNKKYGFKE